MHPELVYLHNESLRQAAEHKEFASHQRAYQTAYISRQCKMDEDYIRGWWKVKSNLWFHLNTFWLVCEGQAAGWNDNWTQSRLLNVGKRQVDIGTTRYYTNFLAWFFLFTNSAPYSSSHLNCTSWGPSSTYTLSNHWQHPVPRQPHHPHNVWPGLSALSDPLASLSEIVDTVF